MSSIELKDKDLVYREEGDEALLFNPENGSIKIMNPTATFIWKKLKETSDKSAVLEALAKEFPNADRTNLEKDLEGFVETLQDMNLL